MTVDLQSLDKRLSELEKKLGSKESVKPKTPRKKSGYNIFMQEFIQTKKKEGSTLSHRELFAEGAKEWNLNKNKE